LAQALTSIRCASQDGGGDRDYSRGCYALVNGSSPLEFESAESKEICYSYNPTFGHTDRKEVRAMDNVSKVGTAESRCRG
jgi:hypothetical protein